MSGEDLKQQLKAKDEEFRALKVSFDDYVESSKELELELEGALEDVSQCAKVIPFIVTCCTFMYTVVYSTFTVM